MNFGPYYGVVEKVHDGDTIHVALDVGFDLTVHTRCRLMGINAAELATDAGKNARDVLRDTVPPGSKVTVISHGWDKYGGRIDANVSTADGRDLSSFMLERGLAVAVRY